MKFEPHIIKNNIIIALFVIVWGMALSILWILPMRSRFNYVAESYALSIFFVCISVLFAYIAYFYLKQCKRFRRKKIKYTKLSQKKITFIILFSSFFSVLGILLIVFDRVYIRGIDYSQGIRAARYQWLASSAEGKGGSIFSILGNLWVPLSYCGLFMSLFHWESIRHVDRNIGFLTGFFVPISQAIINGGRSNVLLMTIFSCIVLILRLCFNKQLIPKIKHKWLKMTVIITLICYFVLAVFASSATGTKWHDYTRILVEFNGGRLLNDYSESNGNFVIDALILVCSYLFHGQWRFGQILEIPVEQRVGTEFFIPFLDTLKRLGLYSGELVNAPALGSNFLNFPGILIYDFGFIGIIFGSIIMGVFLGSAMYLLNEKPDRMSGFSLAYLIGVFMLIFASPMTFIMGFAYFKFIIYAFVLMEVISEMLYGKSTWLVLERKE